jgi:DNA uptake protein ComE-like DNA-binding protein
MEDYVMWLKSLFCVAFALLVTANLAVAQFPGQGPKTPPTFPQHKSSDRADLIDLNSASKEQLATLPGVDETLAGKIIESRPYKKKDELKKKRIVSEKVYRQISDKITATSPKK